MWLREHSIIPKTQAAEAEFEALILAVERNCRKYLQTIYLIRDLYPEYILLKKLLQLSNQKANNQIKVETEDLSRQFSSRYANSQ